MTKQKQKGLIHSNYSGNAWLDVKMREKVKTWNYSTDNKLFFFSPQPVSFGVVTFPHEVNQHKHRNMMRLPQMKIWKYTLHMKIFSY